MQQQHILQVSELTRKVRFLLESELNTVWLCGEISNFIAASSGHWYLSLKDKNAQVRCAMFKGNNRRVRLSPQNGQQVLVRARVSLYEPRGDFQLIIEQMEPAGEGLLRQQYQQLKNKLNQEGLFNLEYKKAIPTHISTVGIITSPTGAAVKDILTVLQRRNPLLKVIIYPALVQGEQAKSDLCYAIEIANQRCEVDVLLLSRGGGSLEDLWPFNEEMVARSVFHSTIPIISAVGHEIDTVLTDYTADLRAPTPSAAAEIVSSELSSQLEQLTRLTARQQDAMTKHLKMLTLSSQNLEHRLSRVHPEQQLYLKQQKADELNLRLTTVIKREWQRLQQQPAHLTQRLYMLSPQVKISRYKSQLIELNQRLINAQQRLLSAKQKQFTQQCEQLHLVSPLATISRGYSVVRDQKNNIIKTITDIKPQQTITIEVSDGIINAEVSSTNANVRDINAPDNRH